MSWLPIGPDFAFAPRNGNFKRQSRRNEWGRQGLSSCIALDQVDPLNIYDIQRPSSGGAGAWKTRNGGAHWDSIADTIIRAEPLADPVWIAINPVSTNVIYMATHDGQGLYISNDRGDTWGAKKPVPARVHMFLIDPTSAGDLAATRIIAATNGGVYYSIDSGDNWVQVLAGDCHMVAAHIPAAGTANYFANIFHSGLHHTTNPTGAWTNLNNQGIGLPAYVAEAPGVPNNFTSMRIDICARNPQRIYVWLAKSNVTEGIYTSNSALTAWTKVAAATPPNPGQGLYNFELAIAPNSPGDGVNDVLFIGSIDVLRSTNSGVTWVPAGVGFHADQQAFAFYPANPGAGVIPVCYIGSDGGIGKSTKFCNPAYAFDTNIADHNENFQYTDTGSYENLNYGKQCSAVYQYASHSEMNALSYIGCQDTGVSCGTKAMGWRGIMDADGSAMAIAPGPDGIRLWGVMGAYGGFPGFRIVMWNDRGEFSPGGGFVTLGAGGVLVNSTSDFENAINDECLVGAYVRDQETTIALAIAANVAEQFVIPASMAGIVMGTILTIDQDVASGAEESVIVTGVTVNSFSAVFTKAHLAGAKILQNRAFASRIDQSGICRQISQNFGLANFDGPKVRLIMSDTLDGELIVCVTTDQKVWRTDSGTTATAATVWNEVVTAKPAGGDIHAVAVTPDKHVYVLYREPTNGTDAMGAAINTPLYEISTGTWVGQSCVGVPATNWHMHFGKLVAHPVTNSKLFASYRGQIFELSQDAATGSWTFTDISEGLPGTIVYDLWAGFHSLDKREETVILRVAIPTRGVWEKVFNEFGQDDNIKLYVRDHFLDQGLLSRSEDGLTNPYDPTGRLYHYKCADVKLDSRQVGVGVPDFFQTDPEDALPISHVSFDKLRDNSRSLRASHQTLVHVQVRNRSTQNADSVKVWAIFCNASAGVPALNKSASNADNFDFWSQFTAAGNIVPALPADSPWTSVGAPVVLNGINGFKPAVASWLWNTPALIPGDPGHYCMVVFIHSAANPVDETGFNVDYITPRNRQIGQKNLHVGEPLPEDGTGVGGAGTPNPVMNEYIEFHNPTPSAQKTKMLFEFSRLPEALAVTLQLTRLDTEIPVADSISGVARTRPARPDEIISSPKESFFRKIWCAIVRFFCAILNFILSIFGIAKIKCGCKHGRSIPGFEQVVYEVEKNKDVVINNVRTAGHGFNAAYFRIKNTGVLPPGTTYSFDVLHLKNDVVIGGSEYLVRIAGDLKPFVFPNPPDVKAKNYSMEELHRLKKKISEQRYISPWIMDEKKAREQQMGKE